VWYNEPSNNIKEFFIMFTQVCVWPGTIVGADSVADFEKFFMEEFGTRVKYIEEVLTKPDWQDRDDPEAGRRNDVVFYVHSEDIPKFAVPRLSLGVRWIEDVLNNEVSHNEHQNAPEMYSIYPEGFSTYRTW
jgi:hypothetical protein